MTHARERLIALARPSTRLSVRLSIRTVVVFSALIFREDTRGYIRSATQMKQNKYRYFAGDAAACGGGGAGAFAMYSGAGRLSCSKLKSLSEYTALLPLDVT